jgi:pre-60S factor REI1
MPLLGDTPATTTATMESNQIIMQPIDNQTKHNNQSNAIRSPPPTIDHEFEESGCLFCDQSSSDLEQNLEHMSKIHGLRLVTTNLLVDIESLLTYFDLVISSYHECLYCGTQRNTLQAVQQHMIAKGHCKYDPTAKDSEFREFYDLSSLEAGEISQRNLIATRLSKVEQAAMHSKSKESRSSKRSITHSLDNTISPSEQPFTSSRHSPEQQSDNNTSSDDTEGSADPLRELSTREQKRSYTLNNQLSQLRADDRRSLMHLLVSQQRTLLATHHKQMEQARRSEQTQRGNLESAGNSFARLGAIRLIRKPPHTGRVQTLKR